MSLWNVGAEILETKWRYCLTCRWVWVIHFFAQFHLTSWRSLTRITLWYCEGYFLTTCTHFLFNWPIALKSEVLTVNCVAEHLQARCYPCYRINNVKALKGHILTTAVNFDFLIRQASLMLKFLNIAVHIILCDSSSKNSDGFTITLPLFFVYFRSSDANF